MKPRYALNILTEVLIMVCYPILSWARFFLPLKSINQHPTKKTPIVVVERWFTQNPLHLILKRYLEKRGYAVYLVNYSTFKGSFHDSAVTLKNVIETNNLHDVLLVGISFGSVSCYLYLQELNGWARTKSFVSVGGTFSGTPLSYLVACFRSSDAEMIPNSDLVERIRTESIKNPDKVLCIRALADEMVPSHSSVLPGVQTKVVDVIGHNNLHVYTNEVFELIVQRAT